MNIAIANRSDETGRLLYRSPKRSVVERGFLFAVGCVFLGFLAVAITAPMSAGSHWGLGVGGAFFSLFFFDAAAWSRREIWLDAATGEIVYALHGLYTVRARYQSADVTSVCLQRTRMVSGINTTLYLVTTDGKKRCLAEVLGVTAEEVGGILAQALGVPFVQP